MINFKCLHDNILLEPLDDESAGGIIISEDKKKITTGKVVAIGPGRWEAYGLVGPMIKVGDVVYFNSFSDQRIRLDGKEYSVVPEKEVIGYVRNKNTDSN